MRSLKLIALVCFLNSCNEDSHHRSTHADLTHRLFGSGSQNIQVIAHRGNAVAAPENTLSAFRAAADAKADFVELDYRMSSDGVPMVLHDSTVDRTTNAQGIWGQGEHPVSSYAKHQIEELDAGQWFKPEFSGEKVPSLADALNLIEHSGAHTLIERKDGDAKACAELVTSNGYLNQVRIQSFDWNYIADFEKVQPDAYTMVLGRGKLSDDVINRLIETGTNGVSWNHTDLNRAAVLRLHARGLSVYSYTVNEAVDIARMQDIGVDGIITDDPYRTRIVLNSRVL